MQERCDIAIVGGGMVGASLALLCAKANPHWKISIIEPQPFTQAGPHYQPSFDARSTAISAGSINLLADCDIWPALAEHVTYIQQVHVSDQGYLPGQLITAKEKPLGAVIENAWLGQVLMQACSSHQNIHQLTMRVQKCCPLPGRTQLQLVNEKEEKILECTLAVIADGMDSPIRKSLGINVKQKDYAQGAIITNVEFSEPHRCVAYERFTSTGPIALLPLGEAEDARQSALIWTLPLNEAKAVAALDEKEFLLRLQKKFGHRVGRFTAVSKCYMYPLAMREAVEQVRTGIVLMGNAAHALHPVAGQGFNLSLRDSAALAVTLKQASASGCALGDLHVLEHYLQQQSNDQLATAQIGDKLVSIFGSQSLPLVALRHLGLLSLELLAPLRDVFSRQVTGLAGVDYGAQLKASTASSCHKKGASL